jgi:hypothetical protein
VRTRTVVLILLICLSTSACLPKRPTATIPADQVPHIARESEEASASTKIVWHASYEQQGKIITVSTGIRGADTYQGPHVDLRFHVLEGDASRIFAGGSYKWDNRAYDLKTESRLSQTKGKVNTFIYGHAITGDAHQVTGTTNRGLVFTVPVVNGFWVLMLLEHSGADAFEEVLLQNAEGQVIHTYELPPDWKYPI